MKWNYHYPVSAEILDVRITEEHHHILLNSRGPRQRRGQRTWDSSKKGCAGARGIKKNILLYLSKRSTHQAKFVCPVKPGLVDYCSHNPMDGRVASGLNTERPRHPQLKWGRQEIASALFLAQALVPTGDYLPVLCWLVNDKQLRAFLP